MPNSSTNSSGQSHVGTGSRHGGHGAPALVNHEITGPVRWLDTELVRVVVHVEDTDSHAGRFLGQDVTVDLADAHLQGTTLEKLTPGVRLRVKLRLPGDQGAKVPELVQAHSVYVA